MKHIYALLLSTLLGGTITAQEVQSGSTTDSASKVTIGYDISKDSKELSGSVDVVNADELISAETDIVKALYSQIAGLNITQGSGSSSDNYASMTIHGRAPLVLIDGFPRDLSELTMEEVASITVIRDAAALAIYGVRGANGVVNVTTKRGRIGKFNISADYQLGVSTQTRTPIFASADVYAQAYNSALALDGLTSGYYSSGEIDLFKSQKYADAYPNVNWWDEVYNNTSVNHQLDMTFDGGTEKFSYFTAVDYSWDRSMYKDLSTDDRYSTTPFDVRLNLRSNIDVKLTNTTKMSVGAMVRMQEINSSISQSAASTAVYSTPSAAFPVRTSDGIYGGNSIYGANNPVALLQSAGHIKNNLTTLYSNLRLTQDLSSWTEGLYADAAVSFDTQGYINESSSLTYQYVDVNPTYVSADNVTTSPILYSENQAIPTYSQSSTNYYSRTNFQAKIAYDRTFDLHSVNGAIIYDQQANIQTVQNNTFARVSAIATASYDYDKRYFIDATYSRSGTNVLEKGSRYTSYPAVSAAWLISNEEFFNCSVVDYLRLSGSFGLSGWDGNTAHELFRESYDSYLGYYIFNGVGVNGYVQGTLPTADLTIEKVKRATIGVDAEMFNNRLTLSASLYNEERSNILVAATSGVSDVIGIGLSYINAGVYSYKGVDVSLGWRDCIGEFNYGVSGIFSLNKSKIIANNEEYKQYDYLYTTGNAINQCYGLEAVGFFESQLDINNSPVHTFSTVKPGDIKYKDQNGDNIINDDDVVKMYHSSTPEIYYGVNLSLGWRKLTVDAQFQGVANRTINLRNSPLYTPLVSNGNISQTFLDNEQTWTAESAKTATMPRLTTQTNSNNYRNSSLWYRDGSFLKLRHIQFNYEVFDRSVNKFGMEVYLRGTDLFSIDKIDFADPEQISATYPSQRSFWAGVKFNF